MRRNISKRIYAQCQKCKKDIVIDYDLYHVSIMEKRQKTPEDRKHEAFPENEYIYKPHACKNACPFPNSKDCIHYHSGECDIGHCIDEITHNNQEKAIVNLRPSQFSDLCCRWRQEKNENNLASQKVIK